MRDDEIGVPLSRRVPGAARPGPGQSVRPVLPEDVLTRMQAAVDAEHAQAGGYDRGDPNTEPLPAVIDAGSGSKVAQRPPSPTGMGPEPDVLPDQPAEPEPVAEPPQAEAPQAEAPLRTAKALRVAAELRAAEDLRAAEATRVSAAEPAAVLAPEPAQAAAPVLAPEPEPEPAYAAASSGYAESAYQTAPPRAPETSSAQRSTGTAAYDDQAAPASIGWLWPDDTTPDGGGPRWRPPRKWSGGGRWRYRTATLVAPRRSCAGRRRGGDRHGPA